MPTKKKSPTKISPTDKPRWPADHEELHRANARKGWERRTVKKAEVQTQRTREKQQLAQPTLLQAKPLTPRQRVLRQQKLAKLQQELAEAQYTLRRLQQKRAAAVKATTQRTGKVLRGQATSGQAASRARMARMTVVEADTQITAQQKKINATEKKLAKVRESLA